MGRLYLMRKCWQIPRKMRERGLRQRSGRKCGQAYCSCAISRKYYRTNGIGTVTDSHALATWFIKLLLLQLPNGYTVVINNPSLLL